MIVLLTGATGFVGRQILDNLLKIGVEVRLVARAGHEHKLPERKQSHDVIISDDIFSESETWWAKECSNVDIIIHSAWYTEPGKYLTSDKNIDCVAGTLRMAKGAAKAGVRRIVGIGTCFEYDLSGGVLSTETPLLPKSLYAASKTATFQMLSCYLPEQGIEFAWCRLFYLYGDGEDERRLVPYIHSRLSTGQPVELTNGMQIRDFMNVRDAGREIANVALSSYQGAANICSGIPITVRQLAESIAAEYGRIDLLCFGSRKENIFDPKCVIGMKDDRIQ